MADYDVTTQDLKQFMKKISSKFTIPYKDIVRVWNDMVEVENSATVEGGGNVAEPQPAIEAGEETVSVAATCGAVKKDKTVCGKKATVGDRCSAHKPRGSKTTPAVAETPAVSEAVGEILSVAATCVAVKKDKTVCGKKATVGDRCGVHKPRGAKACNNHSAPTAQSNDEDDEKPSTAVRAYRECIKDKPYTIHPRLGLVWDQYGTRFVFSRKFEHGRVPDEFSDRVPTRAELSAWRQDGSLVVIARYRTQTAKLTASDVSECESRGLRCAVTNLLDIQPEFRKGIEIDGEFDRIRWQVENEEPQASTGYAPVEGPVHSDETPQVETAPANVPQTHAEVEALNIPELIGMAASLGISDLGAVDDKRVVAAEIATKVLESSCLPCASAHGPAYVPKVKNLPSDPRKFPKKRRDTKTMDIVDAIKEITLTDDSV